MNTFNWHELSYEEKIKERFKILNAHYDTEYQEILKSLYKQDTIFFIESQMWTYDPSKSQANIPFILYPFQKNIINWYDNLLKEKKSGLIEKSRQMGITHLSMSWLLCHWLFDNDFNALVGSRTEVLVDKSGKTDTLMWKFDYNLNRLPKWLLPKGWNPIKDRRYLILVNREKGGTIFGESANENFGRGSTLNCAMLDELSSWPYAEASWTSVSESTKTRIAVSTPKPACFFKTLRFSNQVNVKTVHWREHPEKDEKWYENKKNTMSAEALATEIDINYSTVGRGKVYEEIDFVVVGKHEYNSILPIYTAIDFGYTDNTAIVWAQHDPKNDNVYLIDSYQNSQRTIEFYIPFYTGIIKPDNPYKYDYTTEEKQIIEKHRLWKRARNFGDPAGAQKTITDTSVIKKLAKEGIHIFTNTKAQSFDARRGFTKTLLRHLFINEGNELFIDAIKQSRYPKSREGSQRTSGINKPIHDWTADYRSALEYLAVNLKLKKTPSKRVNYLDKKNDKDEDDNITKEQLLREKKNKVIRYAFIK